MQIQVLAAAAGLHFAAAALVSLTSVKLYERRPAAGLGFALTSTALVVWAEYVIGGAIVMVSRNLLSNLVAASGIAAMFGVMLALFLADPEPEKHRGQGDGEEAEDPFEEIFDV
jgi:NAD/NADP transhydrogenase beta subunit